MKLKALSKTTIKYFLLLCEIVGQFTADLALTLGTLARAAARRIRAVACRVYVKLLQKHCIALKKQLGVVFSFLKKVYRRARSHASDHGFFKGLRHFFTEAAACMRRNREQVSRALNRTAPIVAAIVLFVMVASFSNVTLAYEVSYSGETLGYITDQEVLVEASDLVSEQLPDTSAQLTTQPQLSVKLVSADSITDADKLSEAIIESSDELSSGYGLYVDDKFCLAATSEQLLRTALDDVKNGYMQKTGAEIAEICEHTELREGLFYQSQLCSAESINEQVDEYISVRTVADSIKKTDIDYKTVTAKDNTKYEGYKKVSVAGVKGVSQSTVQTVYVDGKKQSSKVISTIVAKQPVDEEIIIGTRSLPSMSIETTAQYCWPVARVSQSYVSCYFSYGGHKGVDIAAPNGTQIYAAASGVVTMVEYSGSSYGNQFIIDCGDGITHRYAHCSSINVEVGDVVSVGDSIAKVGSTGNSTGPHLHFEVIKNGSVTNPAPYLGMN